MTTSTAPAYGIDVPDWSEEDPASLEAWFGNYSFFDHYRKVILSNCMELERAKAAGEKITETRLDSLARLHPNYLQFLADSLQGRTARERNVRESLRNGA
jgi:hypothetical protein